MVRQCDLIRLQYEIVANPYYNDIEKDSVKIPFAMTLFSEFDKITDELVMICKKEAETYA